jgi:hypothetical protein
VRQVSQLNIEKIRNALSVDINEIVIAPKVSVKVKKPVIIEEEQYYDNDWYDDYIDEY